MLEEDPASTTTLPPLASTAPDDEIRTAPGVPTMPMPLWISTSPPKSPEPPDREREPPCAPGVLASPAFIEMEDEAPSIVTLPAEKALLSPEETRTDPVASPAEEPDISSTLPDFVTPEEPVASNTLPLADGPTPATMRTDPPESLPSPPDTWTAPPALPLPAEAWRSPPARTLEPTASLRAPAEVPLLPVRIFTSPVLISEAPEDIVT